MGCTSHTQGDYNAAKQAACTLRVYPEHLGFGKTRPEGYTSEPRMAECMRLVPSFKAIVAEGERLLLERVLEDGDKREAFDAQILMQKADANGATGPWALAVLLCGLACAVQLWGGSACEVCAGRMRTGGSLFDKHLDNHDVTPEEEAAGRKSDITHSLSVMLTDTPEGTPRSAMQLVRHRMGMCVCMHTARGHWTQACMLGR